MAQLNHLNPYRRLLHGLTGLLALWPVWGHAQSNWPSKPIHFIVPF